MNKIKTILFIFLTNLLTCNATLANVQDDIVNARYHFLNAEKALKQKDFNQYLELKNKVKSYPLYPYLVYEGIKYKILWNKPNESTLNEIQAFENEYPDFPFRRHLREAWLSQMAKKDQWSLFLKGFQSTKNEEMQCYYHLAKYNVSHQLSELDHAKDLWVVAHSQPKGCDLLFRTWAKNKGLTHHAIWARFELALDHKEEILAKYLMRILPAKERAYALEWQKLHKNPHLLYGVSRFRSLKMPALLEAKILRHTLKQLAKQDGEKAVVWWQKHASLFHFSETQQQQLYRDIAIYLAHQKNPLAHQWLKEARSINSDPLLQQWQIRMSLYHENWQEVLRLINLLPAEEQKDNIWLYWRARALENLNQEESAKPLYKALARTRGYYGFLASLRLNVPISFEHVPLNLEPWRMDKVLSQNNIKRFVELTYLKRTGQARHEWMHGIENLLVEERPMAAKIVSDLGYHDLAIHAMNLSHHKNDIFLRFPLAYQEDIFAHAKKYELDPAWIFAIARQESTFHTDAVSPVGARGLMQLMPSTAEILSKNHKIPYHSEMGLHEPQTNINLGSAYLKKLQTNLNESYVLATASYNAGPLQIRKWMPNRQLDADIWIESIPFLETREYVKNVISLTSIYRHRLKRPPQFAKLMQPIPAKA